MKKNFGNVAKKAMAVVAMAAAVVTAVPGSAMAGTSATKGCTVNTSTGYHIYRFYCTGFSSTEKLTHSYYSGFTKKTCTYTLAYHGSKEQCEFCGKDTYVRGTHCDNAFHQNCSQGAVDYGYCNGLGSDVTIITQ